MPPIPDQELVRELRERLKNAETELATSRKQLQENERELGRLRAVEERVAELKEEVERTRRERVELEKQVDKRIEEAVRAALADVQSQHEETVRKLSEERDQLRARVKELEDRREKPGDVTSVTPTQLAGKLASVLDQLAAPEPAPGKEFSTALTGLEVEARGLLEAPAEGEEEPVLKTGVGLDPAQLSTVRMTFRLLPHVAEPPPPEG